MKELKIFAVVAAFSLILYWGVEPFAHSQMHKHVDGHGLVYDGKADTDEVKTKLKELSEEPKKLKEIISELEKKLVENKDINKTEVEEMIKSSKAKLAKIPEEIAKNNKLLTKKKDFWAEVHKITKLKGNPTVGEGGYAMCMGCHMEGAPNMGGAIPPPLDHAGAIYDKNYLIALIKDPAMAMNTDHKFADTMMHPMGSVKSMFVDGQAIADVVAYIAKEKAKEPTPKIAYQEACMRCHANRYGKLTQLGEIPKFKTDIMTGHSIAEYDYKKKVAQEQVLVSAYMGKLPPDLSIIYRARSESFLETLMENPQSQLAGTAMPRVGLNKQGMEKVMTYLQQTGDPSKPKREALGPWVIGFFIIFTILAFLWKQAHWRDLH